jgi:hypothetical protein
MKKVVYILTLSSLLTGVALSQEVEERGKVAGGFSNISLEYGTETAKGVNGSFQVKVAGGKGVKLEGVADGTLLFIRGERLQTYIGGPQVGVNLLGGRINPFVRAMYGASIYEGSTAYTHSAGLGVDVRLTERVFFRGTYDRVDISGIPPFYRTTIGVGAKF